MALLDTRGRGPESTRIKAWAGLRRRRSGVSRSSLLLELVGD